MNRTRNQIYTLLFVSCLAGYVYLFYILRFAGSGSDSFCLFKNITGLACPSCGSTRAVIALMQGRLSDIFYYNPIGLPMATLMLIAPLWISRDLMARDESLYIRYRQFENLLRRPSIYFPAILLVVANWTWTMLKGL